jgi:hypothetical protein
MVPLLPPEFLSMLSELYQGRPVTSVRIGQGAGGVIRGWVPADAEVRC